MAADELTLKRIAKLHPNVRQQVQDMYIYANNKLLGNGVRLRFTQTLRTLQEQNELYALGRTVANPSGKTAAKPLGNIVTNAIAGTSYHNYGLAFDIVLLYNTDKNGTFKTASWEMNTDFLKVKEYFKLQGWAWGGDFKSFKDYPHFQKTFGYSTAQLKLKLKDKYPTL